MEYGKLFQIATACEKKENTPSSKWQRHPRDSQLWTNAKPMHGVATMVAGKFTYTKDKPRHYTTKGIVPFPCHVSDL